MQREDDFTETSDNQPRWPTEEYTVVELTALTCHCGSIQRAGCLSTLSRQVRGIVGKIQVIFMYHFGQFGLSISSFRNTQIVHILTHKESVIKSLVCLQLMIPMLQCPSRMMAILLPVYEYEVRTQLSKQSGWLIVASSHYIIAPHSTCTSYYSKSFHMGLDTGQSDVLGLLYTLEYQPKNYVWSAPNLQVMGSIVSL